MEIKQASFSKMKSIKNILFSSYFNLIESQFSMMYIYLVFISIEYFQNINLILFHITSSTTNEEIMKDYPYMYFHINKIKTIYILYPQQYNLAKAITCVIMSLYILFFILLFSFKKINPKKPRPIYHKIIFSVLLFLQIITMSFLSTPIFNTLLSFYQCNNNKMQNYTEISCYEKEYYTIISISSIGLFFFIIINILNSFFLIDHNPSSKLPFASVFSTNILPRQLHKLVLCLFYTLSPMRKSLKIYCICASSCAKFIYRFFEMTFYKKSIGWFLMIQDTGELFFSIMAILQNYISFNITLPNIALEIAISIMIGIGMNILYHKLQYSLFTRPFKSFKTQLSIIMKMFLLFNYAKDFKTNDFKRNMFMSVLHLHRLNCIEEECQCQIYAKKLNKNKNKFYSSTKSSHNYVESENKKKCGFETELELSKIESLDSEKSSFSQFTQLKSTQIYFLAQNNSFEMEINNMKKQCMIPTIDLISNLSTNDCVFGFLKLIFEKILDKVPNAILSIFLSYIIKDYLHNHFKGLYEMMKLNKKTHSFSEKFGIFCFRSRVENNIYTEYKKNLNEDLSIELVLEYNEITNKIIENMETISKEMYQFWSIITMSKFTTVNEKKAKRYMIGVDGQSNECPNIYTCAINASKHNEILKKSYDQMLNTKHFINKKVLFIYIIFLEKVVFNIKEVKRVKSKLKLYEDEHNLIFEQLSQQNAEIYSLLRTMDKVSIIIISGDMVSLGKILSVNHQFCSIFQYTKEELNKDTLNKLMPSYIGQYHDEFIHRFFETSHPIVLDKLDILYGLSKEGLSIPTYLYVKLIPDLTHSVRFVGIMKPLRKNHPFLWPQIHHLPENYEPWSKSCCILLVTDKGEVFGANKNSLKAFGIPLTLLHLSNEKSETPISLQTLFPTENLDDEDVKVQLNSQVGKIIKLDSRRIRHLFDDYKESITDSDLQLKKTLDKLDKDNVFREHSVLCFTYQLQFNAGQVHTQIFKLIPLKEKPFNDSLNFTKINGEFNIPTQYHHPSKHLTKLNFASAMTLKLDKSNEEDDENTNKETNDEVLIKRRAFLNDKKTKLTSYAVPGSIKLFALIIIFYLITLFTFTLLSFILSDLLAERNQKFITNYLNTMERNFYYSLVIMNFNFVTLYDNELVHPSIFNRSRIISIITENIQILVTLNNEIYPYITFLIDEYESIVALNIFIDSLHLDRTFHIYKEKDRLLYIIDQVLIVMNELLKLENLKLPSQNDLFYYNNYLPKSKEANLVRNLFFVFENYINLIRNEMDKTMEVFYQMALNNSKYIDLKPLIYIFIPSYCFIVFEIVLFYFVLKKIADYKTNIIRLFYFIERNYGIESMRKCSEFLEFIEKFVSSTDTYSEYIEKEKEIQPVLVSERRELITQTISDNYLLSEANRLNPTESERTEDINNNNHHQGIAFWRVDKINEDMANSISDKSNTIINQLAKSKQIFWKHLCIIYSVAILLFVISIIYHSVSIALTFRFREQWTIQADPLNFFGIRGWTFINLLFMSRQIIFRNSNTSALDNIDYTQNKYLSYPNLSIFDYYSLYLNQTDIIENFILLLSNERALEGNHDFIDAVCRKESELNSDKYCKALEEFDPIYYENYIKSSCEEFYINNQGIKDNIKIVYSQLKNNFPIYDPTNIISIKQSLNTNINFFLNTELYISLAMLSEISTLKNSVILYGKSYQSDCVIQIVFYSFFLIIEGIVWVFIIIYLISVLSKDKLIINLLPFESIMLTRKALNILKKIEKN